MKNRIALILLVIILAACKKKPETPQPTTDGTAKIIMDTTWYFGTTYSINEQYYKDNASYDTVSIYNDSLMTVIWADSIMLNWKGISTFLRVDSNHYIEYYKRMDYRTYTDSITSKLRMRGPGQVAMTYSGYWFYGKKR